MWVNGEGICTCYMYLINLLLSPTVFITNQHHPSQHWSWLSGIQSLERRLSRKRKYSRTPLIRPPSESHWCGRIRGMVAREGFVYEQKPLSVTRNVVVWEGWSLVRVVVRQGFYCNQYSQYSCPAVMWHFPVTERQNTDYQLRMWTDCSVIWHAWGKAHHLTCIISQTKCFGPRPRMFADISQYCSRESIIQTQFYQNLLSIF